MKLAPEEITTMQVLEGQATKGPWTHWTESNTVFYGEAEVNKPGHYSPADLQICQTDEFDECLEGVDAHPIEDAAFIAAARTFVPRAIEHITFTEASTQEALLILDDVASTPGASDALLLAAIEAAIQKLRPTPAPIHDAAALAQLATNYTDLLAYPEVVSAVRESAGFEAQPAPMVVAGRPSNPTKCSPLSCSGCAACYKAGEPAPTTPTELPMLEGRPNAWHKVTEASMFVAKDYYWIYNQAAEVIQHAQYAGKGTDEEAMWATEVGTIYNRYVTHYTAGPYKPLVAPMLEGGEGV